MKGSKFLSDIKRYEAQKFMADVMDEVERAASKHAPLNSLHEAYSVILEEVDEFWDEVKKKRENRDPHAVHEELVQIAAMACRAVIDCDPNSK